MWKWLTFPRDHIYLPLTGTQQPIEHSQWMGDVSKMSHTLPSIAHFFFTDSLFRESSYIRTRWAETCIRSSSVLGLLFFFCFLPGIVQPTAPDSAELRKIHPLTRRLCVLRFDCFKPQRCKQQHDAKMAFGNSANARRVIKCWATGAALGDSL